MASAGVGVTWDLFAGKATPDVAPSADFSKLFANFNPVPNLFGQATNATDDPSARLAYQNENYVPPKKAGTMKRAWDKLFGK